MSEVWRTRAGGFARVVACGFGGGPDALVAADGAVLPLVRAQGAITGGGDVGGDGLVGLSVGAIDHAGATGSELCRYAFGGKQRSAIGEDGASCGCAAFGAARGRGSAGAGGGVTLSWPPVSRGLMLRARARRAP